MAWAGRELRSNRKDVSASGCPNYDGPGGDRVHGLSEWSHRKRGRPSPLQSWRRQREARLIERVRFLAGAPSHQSAKSFHQTAPGIRLHDWPNTRRSDLQAYFHPFTALPLWPGQKVYRAKQQAESPLLISQGRHRIEAHGFDGVPPISRSQVDSRGLRSRTGSAPSPPSNRRFRAPPANNISSIAASTAC